MTNDELAALNPVIFERAAELVLVAQDADDPYCACYAVESAVLGIEHVSPAPLRYERHLKRFVRLFEPPSESGADDSFWFGDYVTPENQNDRATALLLAKKGGRKGS